MFQRKPAIGIEIEKGFQRSLFHLFSGDACIDAN